MPRTKSAGSSSKARNATPFTPKTEKKLMGYVALASASGVAILALAQSSEAKVIYTAAHQKLPLNTDYSLDVNGDGIADFTLFASSILGGARPKGKTYTFNSDAELAIFAVTKSNQVWGARAAVSALPSGVKVGASGKFGTSNFILGGVFATDSEPPTYYGPWAPQAGNVKEHYVGLKFVIDGEIHYGWARLNAQIRQPLKGNVQAVLTGYAYETVANASIITGEISGPNVAETGPATLGRLAVGAAGR